MPLAASTKRKAASKAGQATPPRPYVVRDYVAIAVEYAKSMTLPENKDRFGRWMKLAAARFLNDLKRAQGSDPPFLFSDFDARNPCDFIEKLPHIQGSWSSPTIVLHPSDIFFIVQLFGFRHADGSRRFTAALKAIARKNAKSTIAAGIGLYCETCEGENGPQIISAATTGSQARIVFDIANAMVGRTAKLREAFKLEALANAIPCYSNAGTFKPINSKASTQDGLNPSCVILDEIHAHKTHDLVNVLRSAAGARTSPLFLYTTTEGYENALGPWSELRHFAKQVLLGIIEADHFLAVYYALDDEDRTEGIKADDDFDEAKWEKANPLMTVNPLLLKEMRKEALEAKQMPGRLAEFRIKRLNRASNAAGGWINLVKWRNANRPLDLDWLKQYPCYGGLDLANTRDLTVYRLVWIIDETIFTVGWRFVPRIAIFERRERGLVPYHLWVNGGHLIEAGDEVTDYDAVCKVIEESIKEFDIQQIGYDPWNAKQITVKLKDKGVPLVEFTQGPKSFHPAMQRLELAYVSGKLVTGVDPVLNWCASNIVVRSDANMNMAPDKKRSPEKIDDIVALLEGIGMAIPNTITENVDDFFADPIIITRR